jgi:hypothetical protein
MLRLRGVGDVFEPEVEVMTKKITASVLILILFGLSFTKVIDTASEEVTHDAMANAVVTYAAVRVLGGTVSMIQESSIEVAPAGVGMNLALGQALDPLNDLLEQFAQVMLVSVVSLGVQEILLAVGHTSFFNVLVLLSGVVFLIALWWKNAGKASFNMVSRFFMVVVLLRFAVSAVVLANGLMYSVMLEDDYFKAASEIDMVASDMGVLAGNVSSAFVSKDGAALPVEEEAAGDVVGSEEQVGVLDQAFSMFGSDDVGDDSPVEPDADEGVLDAMANWWDETVTGLNPMSKMDDIKTAVSESIDKIFNMIVIFIVQTILFPLMFLFALYRIAGRVVSLDLYDLFHGRNLN